MDEWRAVLDLYDRVVQLLDAQRTRRRKQSKKSSDDESLEQLDQWWGWANSVAESLWCVLWLLSAHDAGIKVLYQS